LTPGRRGLLAAVWGSAAILAGGSAGGTRTPDFRVLVFTKTAEYRHDSIPAATAAVERLAAKNDFAVDTTEDANVFTTANLSRYAVVMFCLTTGNVLDQPQQDALAHYIQAGGGFVGVHSASDTEHDWPWYIGLVGAEWQSHSGIVSRTVDVVDRATPATLHLPAHWPRVDEWYAFTASPSATVTVLTTVDDHPLSWEQVYDGGRSWYTAMGHTASTYTEPLFDRFLLGGILWAAGYDLPKLRSVTAKLVSARLQVSSTHPRCRLCSETLTVHADGHAVTTRVPAAGTRTRLTTRPLPHGRWRYSLVLEDTRLQAQASAHGTVRVSG
jgi:uncharacterized protein